MSQLNPASGAIALRPVLPPVIQPALKIRSRSTHSPDEMNESTRDLRVGEWRAMRRSWVFSAAWCQQ